MDIDYYINWYDRLDHPDPMMIWMCIRTGRFLKVMILDVLYAFKES